MNTIPLYVAEKAVKTANAFSPFAFPSKANGSVAPLTTTPQIFYLRRDTANPRTQINVFSPDGTKPYVYERQHRLSSHWRMSRADTSEPISVITLALTGSTFEFYAKPGLKKRKVATKLPLLPIGCRFYLNDGAMYQWDANTRYLERVINPGGGVEEKRQRLGHASLLRRFSFDWEIQIDPRVDPEVALTTVLIPLLTEWPNSILDHTAGVRAVLPPSSTNLNREFVDGIDPSLLVYSEPKSDLPKDFFNPPGFMHDPWIEG